MNLLNEKLRSARDNLRLTRPEACDLLGISKSTLQAWEVGDREPSVSQLFNCAKVYGVSASWLLSLDEEATKAHGEIDTHSLAKVIEAVETLLPLRKTPITIIEKAELIATIYMKVKAMDEAGEDLMSDIINLAV